MKPEDVPDELLLPALSAATGKNLSTLHDLIEVNLDDHEAMARALAAVLPEHERQVRAKVADEISRVAETECGDDTVDGMRWAAEIARGGA